MCCFSKHVEVVADTNIFARAAQDNRQFLVYSMTMSAQEDLAMILPLPIPKGTPEDGVRFISLEKYAGFLKEMAAGFALAPRGIIAAGSEPAQQPKLKVVEVGTFEASFVPTVKDFARLDERFRLPLGVWDELPGYRDYGFAVFKLKKGARKVHPMAFEFPRSNPRQLFFPTVHIHHGKVHKSAEFDHALYCQVEDPTKLTGWKESVFPVGMYMQVEKAQGLLDPKAHCYRKLLRGQMKNEDILV